MHVKARVRLPGLLAGIALAPVTAAVSYLRHARMFHPSGTVLHGVAVAVPDAPYAEVGARLAGPVLVRFSSAWWKARTWPDVLGCAVRFRRGIVPSADAELGDQDLLLATIRNPFTTLLAPLSTRVGDFLDNDYFGVSPFEVPPLGRVKVRLVPIRGAHAGSTRQQRLDSALHSPPLRLELQMRADRLLTKYQTVALIDLIERVEIDQDALHFEPFRTGRELEPVGFVHAMRVASYAASRWGRGVRAHPAAPKQLAR